jgi:GT2 family glycosyltransferase
MNKTGILIPVHNNLEYTIKCLSNLTEILRKSLLMEQFPVILADDGSTDGTADWVKKYYPGVIILKGDGNLWWSGGINLAAHFALEKLECNYVLLWNNDIVIGDDYFRTVISLQSSYDESTIIGSKIYADFQSTTIWSMGGWFNSRNGVIGMTAYMKKETGEYDTPVETEWLTGMGTIVPAKVVREIGYWDEKKFPQYIGDTEFTYRARLRGFRNIVDPRLVIWNDVTNTGMAHGGSFRKLLQLVKDRRSLYNYHERVEFYKLYATSLYAWTWFLRSYFVLFSGFLKWKILALLGIRKKT